MRFTGQKNRDGEISRRPCPSECQKTSLRKDCQGNAVALTFNPGIAGFAGERTKIVRFSYFAALQTSLGVRQG
jgi:hypothetical protein